MFSFRNSIGLSCNATSWFLIIFNILIDEFSSNFLLQLKFVAQFVVVFFLMHICYPYDQL